MAGQEAIVIPIIVDPRAGVAGLKALGDQAVQTNKNVNTLGGASEKLGDAVKGAARNMLAMFGAMKLLDGIAKAMVSSFIDMVTGANKLVTAKKLLEKSHIQAIENTQQELVQLQAYLAVAKNAELSYTQRQGAIEKLQKLYPEYLENITLEKINSQQAADAVDKLTSSLVRKAQADILIKQIAEMENGVLALQRVLNSTDFGVLKKTAKNALKDIRAEIVILKNELANLLGSDSKSSFGSAIGDKAKVPVVKIPVLKVQPKKINIDWGAINKLYEFKMEFPDEARTEATAFGVMFKKELAAYFKTSEPTDFTLVNAEQAYREAQEAAANLLEYNEQMAELISSTLSPAFESMFDAIINREDALKAFFKGIGDSVKQLVKQLIAAAIQAAALSLLTGGAGAPGGFSFAGAFRRITGFASGGLVTGPVSALVGEGHGTSRSNPEVVSPLDRLKSFFSDMLSHGSFTSANRMGTAGVLLNMPQEVRLRASGRDLVGVFTLEQLSQARTG